MERLFFIVIKMNLVSLYCIGFVLFVRLFLKKAPKIYSYLSGGNVEEKEKKAEEALVSYIVSDGSVIEIPMYRIQNVRFAKEDGKRAYVLFLNDRYFDKEDIVSMARNIKFKEGAFD